jgi:hypothetical protein
MIADDHIRAYRDHGWFVLQDALDTGRSRSCAASASASWTSATRRWTRPELTS